MPFGKYKDFKDCVERNQDKLVPEGYCAVIERKILGSIQKKESKCKKCLR